MITRLDLFRHRSLNSRRKLQMAGMTSEAQLLGGACAWTCSCERAERDFSQRSPLKKTTRYKWDVPSVLCSAKARMGALCAWPCGSRPEAIVSFVSFLSEEWYNKSGYFEKMFLIETSNKLFLRAQPYPKPQQKTSVQDGLIMEAERPRLGPQSTSQNLNQVWVPVLLLLSQTNKQTNKQKR